MSSYNNNDQQHGDDHEEVERSRYQDKIEDFRQRREQRKQLDIVTVGEGNKPKKPEASAEKAKESDALPLYRFQRRELFDHDVPNIRQPTVRSVRTLIKNRQPVAKKVVPLDTTSFKPSSAPSGDQTTGVSGMQLMAQDDTDSLVTMGGNARSRNREMDPDEALAYSLQQVVRARKAAIQQQSRSANATALSTVNNTTTVGGVMTTTVSNAPLAVSVAPNDDLDIVNLHTADDTVSYFSTHGSQTAVKYVYLNPVRNALDFRPYDLQVVLRGQQQPEHYVISSTGVVHVKPSHPSEVIALSNWMRESAMFTVLRKIRLFRTYLVHKAFNYWRKNVQLRMYLETRRRLCKKLYISKATFAGATMELVKSSYDLTSTKLLAYDAVGKQDYTIEEFTTLQAQQRTKAAVELTGNVEKMETRLSKLTDAIQQRANVPDLASMESLEQYLLANAVATGNDKRGGGRKAKSMVAAKREQYDRMCELKSSMVEYSMLDSYIRLVDYIASETIFKNALLTVLKLYRVIHDQVDKEVKTLGFQVLVHPTDDGMTFRPSQTDLEKVYAESVEDIVQTVNGISRLLNQKPLKVYFAKTPKLWNIGAEFKRDARVISAQHNTKMLIRQDYELADAKMKLYAGCRQWLSFIDHEWPQIHEEWAANKETLNSEDITAMYEQLERANSSFRVLLATFVGHLLYINAARLKAELEPKIRAIKEAVDETLTDVTRARTKKLQSYFTKKRSLLTPPTNVKRVDLQRFVDFVANLKAANEVKDEIISDGIETDSLYTLMERQGVDMKDDDKQLRELTLGAPTQQSAIKPLRDLFFLETMEAAEAFKEGNIDQAIRELADAVKAVHDRVESYEREINGDDYVQCITPTDQILDQLERVESQLEHAHVEQESLNRCASLLQHPVEWGPLDTCQTVFEARRDVWTLQDTYDNKVHTWFTTPLVTLDVQEMEQQVKEMFQKAFKLQQQMQAKGMQDHVSERVLEALKEMRENMPIILDCGNPNMTSEHWNRVFSQIRADDNGVFQYNEGLNLQTLRERDVWSWKDVVAEQSGIATGEANLVKALEEIRTIWEGIDFDTKKYKGDRNVYILQSLDDIVQQLDDHHVQLQTLMASRFVGGVRGRVEEWSLKLRMVSDVLEEWVTLQKNWMYLEFIFSSDDIKRQLPDESERFDIVDGLFKDIMGKANTVKNVLQICTEDDLLEQLQENNKAIDEIQKKLEEYLETKRVAFPRFYFLSNDELLSILSDVRNPKAVQPHLTKCFDSIAALVFNNDAATEIGGMQSGEGEEVSFERVVHPVGNVEQWLGQIERMMKSSLLMHMREAIEAYPQSVREEWFFQFPAQCVQATDMIVWTGEVENAIASQQLPDYHRDYHEQIIQTVELVKTPLSKLQRTLVGTLIVVDVHNRDVVQRLIDANVEQLTDFEWVQQLKYYWEHDHNINSLNVGIHHSSAHLWYGYEYLGNQPRLVITPLTDRAFLTCTSALAMNLGAAPQGPAGTGKTESVKDLGKALARQVVVFNCSDGINYKTMSRMFAGLAQAGAWACFDEFNRIELEVLSVIAQQMLEIVMALGHNLDSMEFDGHPIKLSRNFGVFITMNPGYAGRTELPDNLKALFRPICMMIPDYALIAEIMFYSEGFSDARTLAQKMVQLYKLSSEQLSKQDHYDFGMRAVKSILVMAGGLKRANPKESEDMLLIRAMRDSNVPKFLREDTILFMALIKDLFPTVTIHDSSDDLLVKYMKADMAEHNLQVTTGFVLKATQLFDTLVVRHGVMMVGQTFCAKTAIVDTLKRTLTAIKADGNDPEAAVPLYNPVQTHLLNPKSVTMGELYGEVNSITREWTDGILSNIARNVTREAMDNKDRQWIIFDGPVDAIWIENMNTVLDDNKMLCLFNGERIKLPGTATFMFEVQDLKVASPATVSRCGMVFVEPFYIDGNRGWKPIAQSLIGEVGQELSKFKTDHMYNLLDQIMTGSLDFIRTECAEWIPSVDAQLAVSCIILMKGYVKSWDEEYVETEDSPVPEVADTTTEEPASPASAADESPSTKILKGFHRPQIEHKSVNKADYDVLFDMYFMLAFVWSIGGNLNDDSRGKFNAYIKPVFKEMFPNHFPESCTSVYDLVVHRPSMKFISWSHMVPNFRYNRDASYFEMFVPTAETTTLKSLMGVLSSVNRNILVNGVTGVGKSVVVNDFLSTTLDGDNPSSKWDYFATAFSAQTNAQDIEDRLESKLYKVKATQLGPAPGKRAVFFVDDLNMPILEKYGASPPIELLRQIITHGGFFDKRKSPATFKEIIGVSFIAACGVPGGGRNEVTARLTSRFHMLCQPTVTGESTHRIFTSILAGFLSIWPTEVQGLASHLVQATKDCYDRIAAEKRPTPAKSHYTFNLRDFGKVIQGLLQAQPDSVPDRDSFIRLFTHELSRVFFDRLADDGDRTWWWGALSKVLEHRFDDFSWLPSYETLIFGSYMQQGSGKYREVGEIVLLQEKLMEYQGAYNVDFNKEAELVFFADAAHHVSRICRICRQPRGHALLVGVGGSGRQSLTRLAAYICDMPLYQIAVTRSYSINDFRENTKEVLLQAGCNNKPVVFLLSDTQIVKEQMLEDINNILNTGEIPNLMQQEDIDRILDSIRPFVKAAGKQETRNVMLAHFTQLCRDNVHIVLTMSPIGDSFRRRLRMFPSLVNCCTIDWFTKWPEDALIGVARKMFRELDMDEQVKESLCHLCVSLHQDVTELSTEFFDELRRHNYTTPTSYLELLNSYSSMLEEQNNSVNSQIKRFRAGLDKLQSTQVMVDEMKLSLVKMQPVLEEAAKKTADIVVKVNNEKKEAVVLEEECAVEEEAANAIKKTADAARSDCQVELDKALPILKAAEDALNELNESSIREMKSFSKPPEKVGKVMEGVLILYGEKDLKWEKSKALLGRMDFISSLHSFPKDDITEKTIRALQKHYVCSEECTAEEVRKTSIAAEGLFKWVQAMIQYFKATRIVQPKREQLKVAEGKLDAAKAAQDAAMAKLQDVQDRVAELERQMQENMDKKKQLEDEMKLTEIRLGRAEKLMSGLASEQIRWTSSIESLKASQATLTGTVAVAAGTVAYLGPFTAPYRERAMKLWTQRCRDLDIPIADKEFDLADIADPVRIREWGQKGLPADAFSVENGIVTTRSQRWCLCIDPQGQANNWIRNMERENKLKIIKMSDGNYMRTLENAIKVGVPVLLENVEESVDAAIDPVLLRQTFKSQGRLMLKLGDTDIDYDPNFRFYMTTKLPNPHYLPELQIKVTIVNFTVTQQGLEEQLLADVVRYECADLETRADRTVVEIAEGKKELKDTEDKILSLLASSTGNILDNQVLIDTLGEAKRTSEAVSANLEVAVATQRDILVARNRYRPVATRGSLIFAVIAEISGINHMYQISLDFFKRLFIQTLRKSEQSEDVDKRVSILLPAVTLASYNTICRGLFEKDKQLFVFLFVSHIFRQSGEFSAREWSFFLKGCEGRRLVDADEERWPEWATENAWNELTELITLPGFGDLKNEIWAAEEEWGIWATTDTAYNRYPSTIREWSEWRKLLVLKVFREDLVSYGMTSVTGHYLGQPFTESPAFDLEASYQDSSPTAPIIFVLTQGTDPTATFTEFADRKGFGERKLMLSLGQDQGGKAQDMINAACRNGSWVYLQNCHVYASWMPALERILEDLMLRDVHRDFRLWLTTMPTVTFPVLVLQSGIKIVKEPPNGLKANIRDSFHLAVTPELWESCPQNATNWKRLLFSLSYFHAIIQERRKFGPLGWNIPYEWNQSDFSASIKSLFTNLSDFDGVPWTALNYMTGVINYGGRVTDHLDSRCLNTILARFFNQDVVAEGEFNITADGIYSIPGDVGNIDVVKGYLSNLPPFEQPELFGLHSNADITFNRATSRKQLATILSVQPRTKSDGGISSDDKVLLLAQEFEGRLPASIDKSRAHEETYRLTEDGTMISLGTVVGQEIDVFNRINANLKSSLKELQQAIKGEVVMSGKLEAMYGSLLIARVPDMWHAGSYLSLKPLGSWMEDTLARIEFFREWNDNGIPASFWISGFFFPQGFLTGVLQTHSRAHKMPIDNIKFSTTVTHYNTLDQVSLPPDSGVYIHGLFFEGARFNKDTMSIDESLRGDLFTAVPVVWLEPVSLSTVTEKEDTYKCPLYKTSARAGALSTTGLSTNYVLSLDIDSGHSAPSHWILRGVALLCMLDD